MTELPEPREDKLCCDCLKKAAITNDSRFCGTCIRKRIKEANPYYEPRCESRGRPQRNLTTLGGSPDLRTAEQKEEDNFYERRGRS